MKKFKRVLITLLLIMLCACVSGCGKSKLEKAQEEAVATSEDLSSHEVGPWYKAMFSKKIVTKKTYEKMQKKSSEAQTTLAKEEGNAEKKSAAKKKAIIVLIIIVIIAIGVFVFKFIILPSIIGGSIAKGAAKAINKQGGIAVNPAPPAQRSGRLAVDYPKLLQQDCAVLGLDYNSVLADFNGNAEKAYETIHVQALKQQYN